MKGNIFLIVLILGFLPGTKGLELVDAKVGVSFEPIPKVGTPSAVHIVVQDAATGKPIPEVRLSLQIKVPHSRTRMLSGDFYSREGRLELLYNFQDAETHVFTVSASSTDKTPVEFTPLTESFPVEVNLPEEPRGVWVKTWIILMGVLLTGMGVGYFATKRFV